MHTHEERYLWLLSKKLSGEILEEEQHELDALTAASPQLRQERDALHTWWHKNNTAAGEAQSVAAFDRLKGQLQAGDWENDLPAPKVIRWRFWMARVAAAVVFFVGGWYLLNATGVLTGEESGFRTEYNSRGTRSQIKLSDGTTVWLNADSELKYPLRFKGNRREVYLKGEAFFDVAKNAEKPFIVHTAPMTVNVLGTSFNVKAYPYDSTCETTLVTGEVEVELNSRTDKKIRLKPDEKLVVSNGVDSTLSLASIREPVIIKPTYFAKQDSTIVETAWVDNKLIFQDEPFAVLATRLELWYNVTIRFENTTISQLRFTGIFTNESLTQALGALQLTEPFRYRVVDENTILIY